MRVKREEQSFALLLSFFWAILVFTLKAVAAFAVGSYSFGYF